jgi:hypothetical protein
VANLILKISEIPLLGGDMQYLFFLSCLNTAMNIIACLSQSNLDCSTGKECNSYTKAIVA